jgi:thiamine-monophosphate kinase
VSAPGLGPGREFDWIRGVLEGAPTHSPQVPVGPGDDAAVVAPDLVLSTDMAIEGVHFQLDWISPEEAGARAVAAALSDLAAMAARVVGILVSVGVPGGDGPARGRALMAGARAEIERWDGILLGGDLTRSPSGLLLDVVAVGRTEAPLLRAGAVPGDELWVTGTLGAAAAAVALWKADRTPSAGLRDRFVSPRPRIGPARWLVREAGARAGLDLSDGLAGDAGHLAAASRVGVELDLGRLPLHPELAQVDLPSGTDSLALALHGGEDYELLVAIPPAGLPSGKVEVFRERFDLSLTRIGRVVEGRGVSALPPGGGPASPLVGGGFDHLKGDEP